MRVGIVTVGDELLAGETTNTNAAWLAEEVTRRGGRVERIVTIPDEPETVADRVATYHDRFDAVLVTGGLGGTHDDLTVPAVADALDREVVVDESARAAVQESAAALADDEPELVEQYDLSFDLDAWASLPAGARHVENPVGLAPGAVVDGVYLLPGVPSEMRGVFGGVADEFGGDRVSRSIRTPTPEGAMADTLAAVDDEFDVAVGSYPSRDDQIVRIRVSGRELAAVERALDWLRDRIETV